MTYMVLSLFFIPCFKWNRHYYVQMSCCNTLYELDPEKGKALARGQQADITQEELEAAKQQLCSSLRIGMDSPGRLDDFYMGQTIAGLSGTMEQLARQIEAVSLEQLVQAASGITLDTVYFLKGETI